MINKDVVDKARNTDLVTYLESFRGFTFENKQGIFRAKQHPSLAIKSDRLSWYWHSKGIGGYGAIDFMMKIENYDFKSAVALLENGKPCYVSATFERSSKAFFLPEKAKSHSRAYAYLTKTRGIDRRLVNQLIQEEKIYEDTKGNAVFIGFDEQDKPTLRGTYTDKPFRMDQVGSDKRYGFSIDGKSNQLYIFESAVDLLSYITLKALKMGNNEDLNADNYLSLGGTSGLALETYTTANPHIKELVFCLDNDKIGRTRANTLAKDYTQKGYRARIEMPILKDYNEDLQHYHQRKAILRTKRMEDIYGR